MYDVPYLTSEIHPGFSIFVLVNPGYVCNLLSKNMLQFWVKYLIPVCLLLSATVVAQTAGEDPFVLRAREAVAQGCHGDPTHGDAVRVA